MNMNKLHSLGLVVLVAVIVGIFTLNTPIKSTPAAAQVPASSAKVITPGESSARMWSGPIQFSDGNFPDFKPHHTQAKSKNEPSVCMTDNTTPRRQSGCIE
jgi:hypothetical protein